MHKRFSVMTNDPEKPKVDLLVAGTVKGFVKISPKSVHLVGEKGQDLQKTVNIIPEKDYPFQITNVDIGRTKYFDYKMEPLGKDQRTKGYRIVVRNKRTEKGAYHGNIIIKTDLKEKPTLYIPVSGRILETNIKPDGKP